MLNTVQRYDLRPVDGRKSFYGKAYMEIHQDGTEILYSYNTKIMSRRRDGELIRHYDGWTQTTGRHIKAFCGLCKQDFENIPFEN